MAYMRGGLLRTVAFHWKKYLSCAKMSSSAEATEIRIPTPFGHIAGKVWNKGTATPILALHGWLDNAGTWDTLVPLLPKCHTIVAIDFPGHGLSSPFPKGFGSVIIDHTVTIHRVIRHFKWSKVIILGHSMGGGVGMLYAGTVPEVVEKLIMIDVLKPLHVDACVQPTRTRASLDGIFEAEEKSAITAPRYTHSELVEKLVKNYSPSITEESAKVLAIRGSRRNEDGTYSFSYDPAVRLTSILSMTIEQHKSFASNVQCDILIIMAKSGSFHENPEIRNELIRIYRNSARTFRYEVVEGTHHVHLNDPLIVASVINKFLESFKGQDGFVSSL